MISRLRGQSQVTAIWQEGETWRRGRFDHYLEEETTATVYDLKWVKSANPEGMLFTVRPFTFS